MGPRNTFFRLAITLFKVLGFYKDIIRGTQHNDTQHNNTQHNDTQHNNTQHNDIELS